MGIPFNLDIAMDGRGNTFTTRTRHASFVNQLTPDTQISGKFGFRCVNRGFLCLQYHISTTLNDNMLNAAPDGQCVRLPVVAVLCTISKPGSPDIFVTERWFIDV